VKRIKAQKHYYFSYFVKFSFCFCTKILQNHA